MVNIFVEPVQVTVETNNGETLHSALERSKIHIETPCGGNGICGGCIIWAIEPDKIPPTPHDNISTEKESSGIRLACVAVPNVDTSIRLDANYSYDNTLDRESKNHRIENPDQLRILLSSIQNNSNSISANSNFNTSNIPFNILNLPDANNPKGLAIDIGTTTIVISLVCLATGKVLAYSAGLNPQIVHGHDILSRIHYASTADGLAEMSSLVRERINDLAEKACKEAGSRTDEIVDITIGANTTMLQIAASIDPEPLGHIPFKVDIRGATTFLAEQFGLNVNSSAQVYIPPLLHAFVGSDISAGLLCCPEFFDDHKSVLYLDIGTNGEICLNIKGRRFTTSAAAGPAFEGMGISSGMRATHGAVERVEVQGGHLVFHLIGDDLTANQTDRENYIKGVCGSGIVDFIAALLTTNYLDQSGKLKFIEGENSQVVKINSLPAFCYGKNIYLTQKDIRQIQLAKGAIRTGVDLLLARGGITSETLDKIYIAGGFGNFLNPVSMERIGLLPKHSSDKVVFCGNASIGGSIRLLTDKSSRTFLEGALHDMEHLQLGDSPEFMSCFIKNLRFE